VSATVLLSVWYPMEKKAVAIVHLHSDTGVNTPEHWR